MSVPTTEGTTEQQKLFAYAYFRNGGKATAAAIEAGYSPNSATQVGSRLLTYANVLALIKELNDGLKEKVIVSKEQIINELAKVGFSDIRKLYSEDNTLINIKDIPDDIAASLSAIDAAELFGGVEGPIGIVKKVKLHDKLKALAQLVDIYGYNAPVKTAQTNAAGEDVVQAPQIVIMPPGGSTEIKEKE